MAGNSPPAGTDGVTEPDTTLIDALRARWQIQEYRFASPLPLIGPLISLLREGWNRVSTKWYVSSMFRQQSAFNGLVVRRLEELERVEAMAATLQSLRGDLATTQATLEELAATANAMLESANDRMAAVDQDVSTAMQRIGELSYLLVRLQRRLAELEAATQAARPASEA